jgi:hypothetical protein
MKVSYSPAVLDDEPACVAPYGAALTGPASIRYSNRVR